MKKLYALLDLQAGDYIAIKGRYVWNTSGGVKNAAHHTPRWPRVSKAVSRKRFDGTLIEYIMKEEVPFDAQTRYVVIPVKLVEVEDE